MADNLLERVRQDIAEFDNFLFGILDRYTGKLSCRAQVTRDATLALERAARADVACYPGPECTSTALTFFTDSVTILCRMLARDGDIDDATGVYWRNKCVGLSASLLIDELRLRHTNYGAKVSFALMSKEAYLPLYKKVRSHVGGVGALDAFIAMLEDGYEEEPAFTDLQNQAHAEALAAAAQGPVESRRTVETLIRLMTTDTSAPPPSADR